MKQRYLAWLLLLVGMFWCRAGYLENVFYNIDEAEYAVAANAMNHGWLPGVDLLGSTKPPGIAVFYNLLFHIFGQSLTALHVVHVLIMIGTGMLVVELAIALWGSAAAIPTAALFWMVSNSYEVPSETLALNVESPGMLFAAAALLLAWTRSLKKCALVAAGLCLGIAALFRQSIALFFVPVAIAVSFGPERKLSRLIPVIVGMIVPWLPVLIWYGASGNLGWAWDSWVRYPITYSQDGGLDAFFGALNDYGTEFVVQAIVPLALTILGLVIQWRERPAHRARFLIWLFVVSILALCSGSRFFGHYWIQLFPAFALLGCSAWLILAGTSKARRNVLTAAIVIGSVLAAVHFPFWRSWDKHSIPAGIGHYPLTWDQLEKKIGDYAQQHTTAGETIVVWGYCPQIYYYANRLPGTRDYLCHYTTGFSVGTFDPAIQRASRPYGHPRAQQMFVEDLEKRKPKYIFDLVQVTEYAFPFFNFSLRDYPDIANYVRQHYVPDGKVGDALVYRLRTPSDTWSPENSNPQTQ